MDIFWSVSLSEEAMFRCKKVRHIAYYEKSVYLLCFFWEVLRMCSSQDY